MLESVVSLLAPEHRDVITTGGQVVIALLVYLGIRQEFAARRTKRAEKNSASAMALAAPTGNGYARRTEDKLDRILAEVDGLRVDHRALSGRVDATGERLDLHIKNTTERNQS